MEEEEKEVEEERRRGNLKPTLGNTAARALLFITYPSSFVGICCCFISFETESPIPRAGLKLAL